MDLLANLALGAATAFTVDNLFYCFIGVLLGTLIGVLPGIGPLATIAMLLPITYKMADPSTALIMLAGIYYGSQYGGSTTAILVNLPGESSSVVTTLDGYQMARRGRAGVALATAALGSFFAGTVATVLIAAFAPPLAEVAFKFGPAEYFSLMVLGLIAAVVLAHGSVIKALGMVVFGLLLSMIGTDVNSGAARFTFGIPELSDGIEFGVIAMGMFGFAEIIYNLKHSESRDLLKEKVTDFMPKKEDWKRGGPAAVRGTILGSFLGILPGGGAVISSFAAYAMEKKLSKNPQEFGKGAIEGVAGRTGLIFGVLAMFNIFGSLLAGLISKKTSPLLAFKRTYLFWVLACAPLAFANPDWSLLIISALLGLAGGMQMVFYWEIVEKVRTKGTAASAIGWLWTFEGTATAFGATMSGYISEEFSPRYCLALMSICVLIGYVIIQKGQHLLHAANSLPTQEQDEIAISTALDKTN